jgi:hypothetical protein
MSGIGRETRTIDVDDDNNDGTFVHATAKRAHFRLKNQQSWPSKVLKNHPVVLLVKHPKTWHRFHQCQLLCLIISLQIAIKMVTKMSFVVISMYIASIGYFTGFAVV